MKRKNNAGRKLIPIEWEQVEQMCFIQCTGEEMAGVLGIDYQTLERAIKREYKCNFKDYYKQKSAGGKMSLRRRQYNSALDGNATMLIWLGKQWLGQSDTVDKSQDEAPPEPKEIIFTVRDARAKPTTE